MWHVVKRSREIAVYVYEPIDTRNGKIVWKHRPIWLFYALMLRTKLY